MYWKSVLIMFSLIFVMPALIGQNDDSKKVLDEIHLKNGSVFKGEILEYERGESLKIRLQNGQELVLEDDDVEKIVQGLEVENSAVLPPIKEKKPVILKTEGLYNTTYTSFASGKNRFDQFTLGAGVHNITGYHWKPFLGIGAGIGIDNYSRRGETIVPVYAEFRFVPVQARKEFYVAAAAGWGFAFKREQFGITEAKGGYMLHPAIGYRAGTSDGTNVTIDVGMKFQDAFFKEELPNRDVEFRDIVFKRFTIRIGLTLWK